MQEVFGMSSFYSVSFICERANLGSICKHSHGEACLCERGKYEYPALGEATELFQIVSLQGKHNFHWEYVEP